MPLRASKFLQPPRAQWFSAAFVLAVFGLLLVAFVWHERTLTLERESDRLLTQIRVVDANLTQELEGVNAAILSMRPQTALSARDQHLNRERSATLKVLSDALPAVRTMALIDPNGTVLSASRTEILGFDASRRGYFQAAKIKSNPDTLYVGAPFTTLLNVYALILSRAWIDDKNQLAGVTAATMDPDHFKVLLRSILYADDMRVTLIHGDGLAFLTLPDNQAIKGANLNQPTSVFSRHLASHQIESMYVGKVIATGDERMVAYRTVRPVSLHMDKPLMLAVSRELHAVLAPWYKLASVMGAAYILVSALTMTGLFFLRRNQRDLLELSKARAQDAREQAERLDLALSGGDLGLFDLDMRTGIRHVSARAKEIVGDGPEDPVDTFDTWSQRRHPDDQGFARASLVAHEQGLTDALTIDYRVRHKAGHWVWIHSRARITQRDDQGLPMRMVGTYQDISERKANEAMIIEFAFSDPLTQLPNRRLLMDRINQAQVVGARSKKAAALLFMDLDKFKLVNDSMGHDVGDLLLQKVAQRLLACVRQSDTVARLGGDEFVVVLDQLGDSLDEAHAHAQRMAEKILASIGEPLQLGKRTLSITSSVGIKVFLGETESAEQLLKQADQALYQAKAAGRNQVVIYSFAMPVFLLDAAGTGVTSVQ